MASCNPSTSIVRSWQGIVEVGLRSGCIVTGFVTFVCAATAVNNLNADAISLRDVEQSRDSAVAGAGIVVFMALLAILMESVIIVLRFCTDGVWNAVVEVVINVLLGVVYLCLIIPLAVLAHDWRNRDISNDVSTIGDSLAAAAVFCFFLGFMFIILAMWMFIFLYEGWNMKELKKSTSAMGEFDLSMPFIDSYQGIVEVIIRAICFVLGFPTFVSAATAVNNLNINALSLGYVEQFRDQAVAVAGIVVFMGLLTMVTEAVIIALRLCTKGAFSIHMGILTSCVYLLMYFCLGISTAVFSEEWKNLESTPMGSGGSGDIPDDVNIIISDSLATASVFCFSSMLMLSVLTVWMFIFLYNDWNEEFEQEEEDQYQCSRLEDRVCKTQCRTQVVVADIRQTYTTTTSQTVEARKTITMLATDRQYLT